MQRRSQTEMSGTFFVHLPMFLKRQLTLVIGARGVLARLPPANLHRRAPRLHRVSLVIAASLSAEARLR
jgi:hypothetical protein